MIPTKTEDPLAAYPEMMTAKEVAFVLRASEHWEDEKHLHPLQLDVIERACVLWSNPGEKVLTPFMGVGSEVCGALMNGRRGIGCELKPSYFRQAIKNVEAVAANGWGDDSDQTSLFVESGELEEVTD